MKIAMTLIPIIISSLIRIWIMRQIFSQYHKKTIIMTTITSIISVVVISLIYIIPLSPAIGRTIGVMIISIMMLYKKNKKRLFGRGGQSLLRIIAGRSGSPYIISALSEESLKRTYIKTHTTTLLGHLIALGIVSGLVFGLTENIIALVYGGQSRLEVLSQRSFLPIIIHMGVVCASVLIGHTLQPRNSYFGRGIGGLVAVGGHLLYNLAQTNSRSPLTIIIVLISLGLIHYSLVRSDIIYMDADDEHENHISQKF